MIRVKPFKVDSVHVWIICPYCRKIHIHGSCGGSGYAGSRVAHCKNQEFRNRDYYIEDIGEAEE